MTGPQAWPPNNGEATPEEEYRARMVPPGWEVQGHLDVPDPPEEPGQRDPVGLWQAHAVIGEMADLLRQVRACLAVDAGLLGAVIIGTSIEARYGVQARVTVPPGLHALADIAFAGLLGCWLAAVGVLAWANRRVLNGLSELRWVTGAPLDLGAPWIRLPPIGADPEEWSWNRAYLLLGAARLARYRLQWADTWTYFTGGCFLAWSLLVMLSR